MKRLFNLLFLLLSLPALSQSVITVPSSGVVATEEWVKEYIFTQLEKYNVSDCELKAVNVVYEDGALEFALTGILPGINNYSVRITKGDQVQYWNDIPYSAGERLRLENVPDTDSARVTVRAVLRPSCYYSFGYPVDGSQNPDPEPPTTTPACAAGPLIQSIYNVSASGLTTQFHGNGVKLLSYKVLNSSGESIRTGQIAPSSSILNIGFSSEIAPGNYTLRLDGVSCTGFSTMAFTYSGSAGGTDPPAPSGNVVAKKVVSGYPEHMNIQITGTGANKVINDLATITPPDGYEFRYFINDKVEKRTTRLTNYPWPSDVPLAIYKMQIRPDVTDILIWGFDEGWKDPNAGRTFSYNTTCAFATFLFDDEASGFNPSKQVVQWMDYMPDMPSTDGKVWVVPKGSLSTIQQLEAKGATTFSKYEIGSLSAAEQKALADAGKTYDEVPQTPQQLSLPDRGSGQWKPEGVGYPLWWNTRFFDYTPGQTEPLTTQQGFDKGNQYPVTHRIIVFENSEQDHAIGGQWPFWKPYYSNLNSRHQARFSGRGKIAHNYFTGPVSQYPASPEFNNKVAAYGYNPAILGYMNRLQAKNFLNAPLSDWPPSSILPGQNMEDVNSACYGLYFNSIQDTPNNPYRMIYSAYLAHKVNKSLFAFMQTFYEWNPNNLQETTFPEGKFYKYVKMPHSPAQCVNYALISRVFMDGFIPFSSASKTDGNFRYDRQYWNNSLWIPNGATSPQSNDTFPYWKQPGQIEAFATSGFEDFIALGMQKYHQSFMQVSGGTGSFLRFRIDGGSWQEVSNININDVIDAYYDKRGICYGQVKNGKLAVMYLNPYADGSVHEVEYQYNGQTYTMSASSIMASVKLHQL
ncbi:hypothetical protein FEM33_01625 [Dyadobacter flavalbus]|uniref:Uncharacterized protein n=1 Tax=Dyadobacter flavalbus TaxID=2579942 RepID=A0A5M8R2B6_9BACT|nr:hypothetical protein [Dyadobacter flavalbus]KAA6441460.1 hypothetical protein FEM33_01625 [Dyadobacter flavalbus]